MATEELVSETQANIAAAAAVLTKTVRKKPRPKHDFRDGLGKVFAHRHVNGGGWVADTAKVDDSVTVSSRASVYHRAKVSGTCCISNYASICGNAEIDACGEIRDFVFIAGKTKITGRVSIVGYARLYGGKFVGTTQIQEQVRVQNDPTLQDCILRESCFIAGNAKLIGTTVAGRAMVGNRAWIVNSRLNNDTRVGGNAIILNSNLNYRNRYNKVHEDGCLLVTENAKIVGVSLLCALLHVKGHGVIVGGAMNFPPHLNDQHQGMRIECIDNLCIANADISTVPMFDAFNNPNVAQRSGTAAAVLAGVGRPFNLENIIPRRRLTPSLT